MGHQQKKDFFLPKSSGGYDASKAPGPPGAFHCPCCGYRTFPVPPEDALAYICPVCMWENDVFTTSPDAPSDENHGLTLDQGRKNFHVYRVCDPRLAPYARPPKPEEFP